MRPKYTYESERRLLEAENARQTAEIEAARSLQLSMLPAALPAVEGLEMGRGHSDGFAEQSPGWRPGAGG